MEDANMPKFSVKDGEQPKHRAATEETNNGSMPSCQNDNESDKYDIKTPASTGAVDASVKKATREKMEMESRRESMPATFEERLKRKLESGRKRDDRATIAGIVNHNYEQSLRHLGSGGERGGQEREPMYRSESMPTTVEERLKRKLESESFRKQDGRATIAGIANSTRREEADGSICSEEIQATITEAHYQVQPMEREEGSNVEVPNICLDEVITELQRVKEENGNITISHQSVSRFMTRLSTHEMESYAQISSRWDSQAGSQRQGNQRSENGGQRLMQSARGIMPLSFSRSSTVSSEQLEDHTLHSDDGRAANMDELPESEGGICTRENSMGRDHSVEDVDDSFCSEEIEPSDEDVGDDCTQEKSVRQDNSDEDADDLCIDAEVQFESKLGDSKIGFDGVFLDLQRFKEENGNLAVPSSHPFVSRLMDKLSSHEMEPFVQKNSRLEYDASSHLQLMQRSEEGSQIFRGPGQALRVRRSTIFNADVEPTQSLQERISTSFRSNASSAVLIAATLVEEVEGDVVVAEPVGFFERKWKPFSLTMCIVLTFLAVLLSLTLMGIINTQGEETFLETSEPSLSPTFDPRPTLVIIQERGYIRCGMLDTTINSGGFYLELCRSVASVLVGNPDSFEGVPVTAANRWQHLNDRTIDLLVKGDTHTIEREVRESSTGAGFTFSSPYNYDGMVYIGKQTFVHCAEEQKRYDECSSLVICVERPTTHYDFLKTAYPSGYFKVGSTKEEIVELMFNNTCNVIAQDKSTIQNTASLKDGIRDGNYILGTKMMTKEPLAIVSRNNDREFSDIINWVIQALFFGEEQGLTKDPTLCQNYTNMTLHDISDLDFLNAVYCVGNYGEITYGEPNNRDGVDPSNRGMNQMNKGTGMLYAISFGNLDKDTIVGPAAGSMLAKIRNEGSLNCGVVVPDSFDGNVAGSNKLVGMGVDYCRTLAAAIFIGDSEEVNFSTFTETDSSHFVALANGTIDVLVGGRVQRKYDFEMSPFLGGFHFSTPYYYGNESSREDVSFYSLATREDDIQFASFVNCMVLATIHAQENDIQRAKSREMPSCSIFGSDLNWALRDAIAYSGSYDEMYSRNFGSNVSEAYRGRNALNKGGPLMLSFPHLP